MVKVMIFKYEIKGKPIPWTAPRISRNHYYSLHSKDQEKIIWQLKLQCMHAPISQAVKADITFFMPVPESVSEKKRIQLIASKEFHIKKPDRSNMLKFIEDCLERAEIITNDSIICCGETRKIYGEEPKTLIVLETFEEVDNGNHL